MQPLVLQLQSECLDSKTSILEVLRKALVVARKLNLLEAEGWIVKELKGYKTGDALPPHRVLTGQIVAFNPFHGWQPVIFQDSREAAYLSKCFLSQPVGELEDLVKQGSDTLQLPFDAETERKLMEGMEVRLQPTRQMSRSSVNGLIDAVRNTLLEWCMQLEEDGILGEGLVFNAKEKETAAQASYTINYNAPVSHSQIQQGSPYSTQILTVNDSEKLAIADFVQELKTHEPDLLMDASATEKLQTQVQAIEAQLASSSPKRSALREGLRTIRNLLEGCAGSLIASGLLYEIDKLLK